MELLLPFRMRKQPAIVLEGEHMILDRAPVTYQAMGITLHA